MNNCLCGQQFSKYKWNCITIKNKTHDDNGWKIAGVEPYT